MAYFPSFSFSFSLLTFPCKVEPRDNIILNYNCNKILDITTNIFRHPQHNTSTIIVFKQKHLGPLKIVRLYPLQLDELTEHLCTCESLGNPGTWRQPFWMSGSEDPFMLELKVRSQVIALSPSTLSISQGHFRTYNAAKIIMDFPRVNRPWAFNSDLDRISKIRRGCPVQMKESSRYTTGYPWRPRRETGCRKHAIRCCPRL
jgi:hypothetical protein